MKYPSPSHEKGPHGHCDPGQPVQSTQAAHSRNFSLLADFLCIKYSHTNNSTLLIQKSYDEYKMKFQMTNETVVQNDEICS